MDDKDRELMRRYIYEVVRRLPRDQRGDVGLELEELIGDMADTETMEQVLTKLGDPAEFAKKYRDDSRHLIGSEYYDNYLWVLKIVLACAAASILLTSVVKGFLEGNHIFGIFADTLANLLISGTGAFGCVTLVFAVMERKKIIVDFKNEKEWKVDHLRQTEAPEKTWTPKVLPPVPDKKAVISRGESLVSVIFIVLFASLLIFAPQYFGAVFREGDGIKTIPLLNLSSWNVILPLLLLGLFAGFADEMLRLVTGCYCRTVMVSNIITNALQIFLAAIALKVFPFWNPNFISDLTEHLEKAPASKGDILLYWNTDIMTNILLAVICGIALLETGVTIYKTLRYGIKR